MSTHVDRDTDLKRFEVDVATGMEMDSATADVEFMASAESGADFSISEVKFMVCTDKDMTLASL